MASKTTKKEEEKAKRKSNRRIGKLSSFIQDSLDRLYSNTFFTQPSNKHDLDDIKSRLDSSIDNIISVNRDTTGKATMSSLYSRVFDKNTAITGEDGETGKSLEELLNDNNIMNDTMLGFLNDTTTIFDLDNKIDTILKYMPKLEEALDCRKDNVLSADHFSKDFINITTKNLDGNLESYNEHIEDVKRRYDFETLAETLYEDTAKYGEQFVYNVPSKKAIARLLNAKSKGRLTGDINLKEQKIICESINGYTMDMETENLSESYGISLKDLEESKYNGVQIEIDRAGMIRSVVEAADRINRTSSIVNEMALSSNNKRGDSFDFINEATNKINKENSERVSDKVKGRFDKTIDDELSFDNFDYRGQDGLVDKNTKSNNHKTGTSIDIPGSIVKVLERRNVIPLYVEDKCFGYYYIETEGNAPCVDYDKMQDPSMTLTGSRSMLSTTSESEKIAKQNNVLRYLSSQIAQFIDANFVNSNQDLRDEIYMILKYNDTYNINRVNKIKVSFIPPDDMEHIYFKKDKYTHRGISDLHKALFPATLYCAMYITNAIWTMTRSQDKRVYYVKQTIDTNIAKTLLTTINQIKKGNMNIRQIENINHILNITGQFNDYVIPKSSSGETPIDFEIMQGQQIEFKTELMNMLEENAVNSTDVPLEMINMRQSVEYATQLSMSSSKFLRKVFKRQSIYQKPLTRLFNKLYNNEYDDNLILEVKLPPPMFLNITNTNQMITNVTEYSNSIAEIFAGQESDDVKAYVIREINKANLGTYLKIDDILDIIKKAKQEAAKNSNNGEENEE